ncbi:MAG: transposase [Oscillospiraceae bacterium]|jgi:putative transposase|nr:transposase [Oscillospiraceae bacterium]
MIFGRHPELGEKWNRESWARGYYVTSVGDTNEEAVKRYNAQQQEESRKEDRATRK